MPRPNQHRKMVSLYISEDTYNAITALGFRYGRTRSDLMRMAIDSGLQTTEFVLQRDAAKTGL